jgi:hypothetical protein
VKRDHKLKNVSTLFTRFAAQLYFYFFRVSFGMTSDKVDTTINIRNVNEKPVFSETDPLIVVVAESMPPGKEL